MPRSSRHKSTRHGSRDTKDSSDSGNESSLRDRKGKEVDNRVLKEPTSSEKRKLDSKDLKDLYMSENHDTDGHGFSKRRKERYDEGTNDRWNGGSDDELGVRSKKSKVSIDSKSKRRDESVGLQFDGEELKKNSAKSEGRHRESSRKEGRNGGVERDRKGREGRSDRVAVCEEEHRLEKQVEKNPENLLQSPGQNHLEARIRRSSGLFDGDKCKDLGDIENRLLSAKNEDVKDGKRRSEKHKDERNKQKYWEDGDRDGKRRDGLPLKDHISRSNDRDLIDDKNAIDVQHKRNKPQDSDSNRELTKGQACEEDLDAMRDRDRDRDRCYAYERDHDQESRRRRDHDRDHDRDGSQSRGRSRGHDRYFDSDRDGLHPEDQFAKYMEGRGRKRSPNDQDDSIDIIRSKSLKNSQHSNEENKSLSNEKVESDVDRGRSQSRSRHADVSLSSHRRKSSPSSISRVSVDEYRHPDEDNLRDRYPKKEERSKFNSTRDQSDFSGVQEKGSKYTYAEKSNDTDGGNATEMFRNRSLNPKNIDTEESRRRRSASIDAKELSSTKDRLSRDLPEKSWVEESSQAESSFYSKASHSNPSSFHPRPGFRAGVDISFDGAVEDDGRINSNNNRFRRSGDPNLGRVHGNTWRGVPNWTTSLPNGFIPFQHGPPHGGFPSIMPPFPGPPLFGIRPPLEINHSGVPYRMPDTERFSSQLHPLGWPNMLDGSSPSHLHGWDGNNGIFRDESHIYGGAEWDESRQMVNGRGWESRTDMWKRQSGSVKRELSSQVQKDDHALQDSVDDVSNRGVSDESSNSILTKVTEMKPSISSVKESPKTPELLSETPTPLTRSMDDDCKLSYVYLSKLEISAELAHSDLYHQCRRLIDTEHCETANEVTSVCMIQEGGARAVSMSSNSVHQSLFHPIKKSVFKRAMDSYEKQRMEMKEMQFVSGEKLDTVFASSVGKLKEQGLDFIDGKFKVPLSTAGEERAQSPLSTAGEETAQSPLSTTDDKAVETTAAASSEKLEDLVSAASQEVKCLEESLPEVNSMAVDAIASEPPVTLGMERVSIIPSGDVLLNATDASTNVDIKGIDNGDGNDSTRRGIGNHCFQNAVSDSLSFSDEIPEALMMPGSIGSESLILSRIHHSPESTH